jgi:ADP-heptose:LPS heptosyltransferase
MLQIREAFPLFDATGYKVILFNTNASDLIPLRRWPKEHFIVLASLILARYPNALILLTGVVSEISWNESIKKSVKSNRCINFAGMTTLADLPALYSISTFMVTNDSGPAHFASLTAMPTFVLFGPETPALYGPLGVARTIYAGLACSPCVSAANHRKSACNDNACLKAITPEMVCEIIRPILDSL